MVEDDIPYRPQRVFELRDRPAQDRLDLNAPRKREVVYDPALAPSRIYPVERPYHDERAVPNYRHDNVAHNYVEPASRRLQDTMLPSSSSFPSEAHRDINRAQPNYQRVQYREIPQDHHYLRQPIERSDNIYREAHNVPRSPGQFEMRSEYVRNGMEERPSFATRTFIPEDRQDQHWHRPTVTREPHVANTAFSEGSQSHPPRPLFPGPAEYIERRAPSSGYRDQRETIWVD